MSTPAAAPLTATAARCHAVVPCAGVGSRMGLAQQNGHVRRMGESGTVLVRPLASASRMRITRLMALSLSTTAFR